jgi:hypothetical protein
MKTQEQLHQSRHHTERRQHQHDRWRCYPVLHEFDRKGRKYCRRRCTRRGDQAIGAAKRRCHQPKGGRPEDAGESAQASVSRSDRRIDGNAKGDRRRQGDQHRGKTAPEITDQLVILELDCQFHKRRPFQSDIKKCLAAGAMACSSPRDAAPNST